MLGMGRGDEAGNLLADVPRLQALADVVLRLEAVAAQQERLPVAVLADGRHVAGNFVEAGELVLALKHLVELGTDQRPLALDLGRPGEHGVVVDAGVADLGAAQVELLHPGDNAHKEAGGETGPQHRLDAVGAEGLSDTAVRRELPGCLRVHSCLTPRNSK